MCARRFGTVFLLLSAFCWSCTDRPVLVVGSKNFNESYLLSEIMAQVLESEGFVVERRFGLGGTLVCFSALENSEIDMYPEYSGTIEQAILKLPEAAGFAAVKKRLAAKRHLELLPPFGFNNTYAIAVRRAVADSLHLRTLSQLRNFPAFRLGFSLEFLNREDGWPGLQPAYTLPQMPVGMEHGLAYMAISSGKIDATDAYSTDGDIPRHDLVLLEDDRGFFPEYLAAPLVRPGLPRRAKQALQKLANSLTATEMQALNAAVVVEGKSFRAVAASFLGRAGLVQRGSARRAGWWAAMQRRVLRHLLLTLLAVLAATVIAIPGGILAYRVEAAGRPILYLAGLLQTIPSIALLALMIPLFGIGFLPAIVALVLYALLVILRNTATGLQSVDPILRKVSTGMGMTPWQQLRYVELPLAAPTILAGIRTATVITIGTATLAAFIGAGGLGEPIVTGLALNDPGLIMEGAIPAALLAVLAEFLFELMEAVLLPAHLRRPAAGRP